MQSIQRRSVLSACCHEPVYLVLTFYETLKRVVGLVQAFFLTMAQALLNISINPSLRLYHRSEVNEKALENRPGCPVAKFPVPSGLVPWETIFLGYLENRSLYVDPTVLQNQGKGADPYQPNGIKDPAIKARLDRLGVKLDSTGYPRNPYGRTGMQGLGLLFQYGPNFAVDPVVFRCVGGHLELLCIQRKDTKEWALPGGFVDGTDQSILDACKRELREETSLSNVAFETVYKGPAVDSRWTDHSWIETTACTGVVSNSVEPRAGDDAAKAQFQEVTSKLLGSLYGGHGAFVRKSLHHILDKGGPELASLTDAYKNDLKKM
jgi:ADP-ribose pyrophosphatase YjhB (NUDIX family)